MNLGVWMTDSSNGSTEDIIKLNPRPEPPEAARAPEPSMEKIDAFKYSHASDRLQQKLTGNSSLHGFGEQIALSELAAQAAQGLPLNGSFDSFGDRVHP